MAALSLPQNRGVPGRTHRLLAVLRLDSFPDEAARVEQVLAPARVGVALCCLVAFDVNPTRCAAPAHALVIAYLGHSLALALLLRGKRLRAKLPAPRLHRAGPHRPGGPGQRAQAQRHNVTVRFGASGGQWNLTVDDDGRGFGFPGRLSLAELDAGRLGPLVIKERVRSIGAGLGIEPAPGGGARLEITIPGAARG